jgi:predicted Holliday junction resolvase-like endonuclease
VAVSLPEPVIWGLLGLLALGWLAFVLAWRSRRSAKRELREARSSRRSQSVRYGQLTERFAPWMEDWPFDPERFRPLGTPVDGVQFTDRAVYLVEIKAADSRLSADQRALREAVREGRVGWLTFRVGEQRPVDVEEPWR